MTFTLIFLALLMATLIWWLVRQSVNVQPWVAQAGAQDVHGGAFDRPAAKTALWVFLAVATSLFALFISAYAMRISFLDWTPLPQPRLLGAEHGGADLRQCRHAVGGPRCPQGRHGVTATGPACGRRTHSRLRCRATSRLEAAERRRLLSCDQRGHRILLPADRRARRPCSRGTGGLGPHLDSCLAR